MPPRIPDIDNNIDDQIEFLVRQKYGVLGFAAPFGQPNRMTGEQARAYSAASAGNQEIAAYRSELSALSPDALQRRVVREVKILRAKAVAGEANRWFNKADAAADFTHWSACPYWTIEEGVALLLGKDPRKVSWEAVKSSINVSTVAKRFDEIRDLAMRAVIAKIIGTATAPGLFLRWAERTGIDVPIQLREAVIARGILIADWQDAYQGAKARADGTDAQLLVARADVIRLTAERDALLMKLDERPAGTWPWGDRQTELLVHLAAAADRFWERYDPSDQTTAPRSAEVTAWLMDRSVPKRVAQVMAQILREDGLPVGPRR
jgi:hypothetical protein